MIFENKPPIDSVVKGTGGIRGTRGTRETRGNKNG
jgi:hypothetical protein